MKILATGPESSGTNYLTELLREGGADVLHRSQPEGLDWIDVEAMLNHPASGYDAPIPQFDAVVIIIRGLMAHLRSQTRRNIESDDAAAGARRRAALSRLAVIMGDPRVTVVTYESLADVKERRYLLTALGLDPKAAERVPWRDENQKYY